MNIDKVYEGNLTIREDSLIRGIVSGEVYVTNKSTLIVAGIITKDLIVEPESKAVVNGVVSGDILNKGELEVNGIVNGAIIDISKNAIISQEAIVNTIK